MDNIAVAIVGLHPVSSKGAPLQADEPRKKAHLAEEIKVKPAGALPVLCPFTAPSLTSRGLALLLTFIHVPILYPLCSSCRVMFPSLAGFKFWQFKATTDTLLF